LFDHSIGAVTTDRLRRGGRIMANQDVAQQTLVEHGMLKHITDALRAVLAWQVQEGGSARKLSSMRFITQSLQRHLDHLWELEEHDGYMGVVTERIPHLGRQVDALQQEHDRFRRAVRGIVARLERLSPADDTGLGDLCGETLGLLDKLDEHSRKEVGLVQEAFDWEEGGEG
jgi:hemerythrin-like domain-containing protein